MTPDAPDGPPTARTGEHDSTDLRKVGPYRILSRLGSGGMGEVFLALDERLDRRVALKRIRAGGGGMEDESARHERFRREARLAARLNHPAIVQIYDVLADGADPVLVFEYVEGTTLRALIEQRPLAAGRVGALGRDVAEGLAEAHRHGIVHRDLKTENILVTPIGRAKIADFGVAKGAHDGLRAGNVDLTASGLAVGTARAMSPEQARGEEADFRSDLFSLGVMLYEMLSGATPFPGENPLATLQRVLHAAPAPLRRIAPETPRELADLVHQLLEKEPHLRPRSADEVAKILSSWSVPSTSAAELPTLIEPLPQTMVDLPPKPPLPSRPSQASPAITTTDGSTGGAATGEAPPRPRRRVRIALAALGLLLAVGAITAYRFARSQPPLEVAVLAPEIGKAGAGRPEVELLGAAVRDAALRRLGRLAGIDPKSPEEVDAIPGPPTTVAKAVGASDLVSSRLDCRATSCRLTLRRIRGADGALLTSESLDLPIDDLALASHAVESQVARAFPERKPRAGSPELSATSADLAELLRLRSLLDRPTGSEIADLLARGAALRARAPRFVDVYLLEANAERLAFVRSRDRRHLAAAYSRLAEAKALDPESTEPFRVEILVALAGGDPVRAAQALDGFSRRNRGDPRVLELGALVANAEGHPREALEKLRAAVRDYPSRVRLRNLATLEAQQGEIGAAREHLGRLLREAPEDPLALSTLAGLELGSGDPARAEALYERIVRSSPAALVPLTNLGLAQMLLGRNGQAATSFQKAAALTPDDPLVALNLADAWELVGRKDDAARKYAEVVAAISGDAAATDPQYRSTFAQALAHLGRGPEAVEAIQQALALAPKNAQVAYEAALVYSLLGEESSALTNARRALALGCQPRWFGFPWFASLRARPDFRALLESRTGA